MQEQTVDQSFALALAHHQAGRLRDAEQTYRRILERHPKHTDSLHLLGVVALQTGHLDAALELVRQALMLRPDAAIYRNTLGQILERRGHHDEAEAAYRAAIELDSHYPEAFNNLGKILHWRDRLAEAEASCRTAIRLQPDYAEPHTNLGNVLKERGELDDAIAAYRRAVELRPDLSFLHSNLLLTLHYHPSSSPEDLAREHHHWAERHVRPLAARRRPHANDPRPHRRLRVGYVSPDFREHAVARFMLPLLEQHDPEQVEVYAYSDALRPDAVTERIRAQVRRWRDVGAATDEQLAERVREDRIDILVDLAAHSAGNRLLVFARKPAPVQVTYLAYCSTTGVDAIDYRLTDRFLDPPDSDLSHYVERSFHLPDCHWCYSAPAPDPDGVPSSRLDAGPPTFGSLNNFAKVTDHTLQVWVRLLQRVPEARLLLHARAGSHHERVLAVMEAGGVDAARVAFVARQPFHDYLRTYAQIDVALDPFPFTGGTTTCDALWMGVPVVSLASRTAVSRSGLSLLSNTGLGHLAARSEEQYIDVAAGLMRDHAVRAALRSELRPRLEASPVMDAPRFARGVEAAFRTMWRTWCEERG